jgi:hypothetical protein
LKDKHKVYIKNKKYPSSQIFSFHFLPFYARRIEQQTSRNLSATATRVL